VEDGAVRTVVEGLFCDGASRARVHYKLPKAGRSFEVEVTVYWQERDKLLRLCLSAAFEKPVFYGQTMFGVNTLASNGDEMVHQKWAAAVDEVKNLALAVVNDSVYGISNTENAMRLSLLRAPAYAAMPVLDRPILPENRFSHRSDQGEKVFSFRIEGGAADAVLHTLDLEAQAFNEKPYALSLFPGGAPSGYRCPLEAEGGRLDAFYPHEGGGYIVRVFNPQNRAAEIRLRSEIFGLERAEHFLPYQFKTFRVSRGACVQTDAFGE
jgi:alpha-mannosidase